MYPKNYQKIDIKVVISDIFSTCYFNWYVNIWMLHQIFMYSNKVILVAGKNNETPIHLLYPIPSPPTGLTNWPINKVLINNLNWQKNLFLILRGLCHRAPSIWGYPVPNVTFLKVINKQTQNWPLYFQNKGKIWYFDKFIIHFPIPSSLEAISWLAAGHYPSKDHSIINVRKTRITTSIKAKLWN